MRIFRISILALLLCGWLATTPAQAYLPTLEEFYEWLSQQNYTLQGLIIESQTQILEPVAASAVSTAEEDVPQTLPDGIRLDQSYRQTIHWKPRHWRGDQSSAAPEASVEWAREEGTAPLLVIETRSLSGTLLHLYFQEGAHVRVLEADAQRRFTMLDVWPPYLDFLNVDPQQWRVGMRRWGVHPRTLQIAEEGKAGMRYVLRGEGGALLVHRRKLLPLRLETELYGAPFPLQLALHYSEFAVLGPQADSVQSTTAQPRYPLLVRYTLNGRLFKRLRVLSLREEAINLRALKARLAGALAQTHTLRSLEKLPWVIGDK